MQSKFDWAGVAGAAVGSAGSAPFGNQYVASAASAIANAATRSAIDGSSFGDNLRAAIPDVIGQALGQAAAGGVTAALQARSGASVQNTRASRAELEQFASGLSSDAFTSDIILAQADGLIEPDIIPTGRRRSDYSHLGSTLTDEEYLTLSELTPHYDANGNTVYETTWPTLGKHLESFILAYNPDANLRPDRVYGDFTDVLPDYNAEDIDFLAHKAANLYDSAEFLPGAPPPLYGSTSFAASANLLSFGDQGDWALIVRPNAAAPDRTSVILEQWRAGSGSGQAIGASGFANMHEVGAAIKRVYSQAYEAGAERYARLESLGEFSSIKQPRQLHRGSFIDGEARDALRRWLAAEGIPEGPNQDVRVNRRVYSEDGKRYRIPDVRIVSTGLLLDGTVGSKTLSTGPGQVRDTLNYSRSHQMDIIRPARDGGSYSININPSFVRPVIPGAPPSPPSWIGHNSQPAIRYNPPTLRPRR